MQHEMTVFEKNDKASIATKRYTLGTRNGKLWLENESGEGMSMSEKNFFDVLDKHFKETF